jgi:hypothetical protein
VRPRVRVLAAAVVAAAVSACGAEALPEELVAVPVDRERPAPDADPTPPDRGDEEPIPLEAAAAEPDEEGAEEAPLEALDDPTEAVEDEIEAAEGADAGPEPTEPAEERPRERATERPSASAPSDGDVARFVAAHTQAAVASDHRAIDLTGDGVREVVVGVRTLEGEVVLILGAWDGRAYAAEGQVAHTGSTGLGELVVRDLDGSGQLDLLLPYVDRPHRGVLVAATASTGGLAAPTACPVPEPTRQPLDFGAGVDTVVFACEQRDAGGRDGLVWAEGVFAGVAIGGVRGRSGTSG